MLGRRRAGRVDHRRVSGSGDRRFGAGRHRPERVGSRGSARGRRSTCCRDEPAVEELQESGTLDEVASEAGLEPTDLVEELIDDPSLFLTDHGQLGYVDALTLPANVEQPSELTTQAVPADVFALNSRPTASRVIYLDFNGHVTNDPAWGSSTIVSSGFDLDGSPSTFSTAERAAIFEIWQRVTEDYLPFDVNVTTADPGVEALRRTGTLDATFGQRVVIGPTNWYAPQSNCRLPGQSCTLGITLVGVFDRNADTPAFVFTADVAVRTIAEAVSHEAGHTFGLSHDGTPTSAYYNGHGVWAPIMGRGTDPSKPFTQWSKGEYVGANNTQDDIEQIASLTGFRPDDHGGSPERATVVASSSTTSGVIGTTGDRDVFAVDVGAGNLAVTLRPPPGSETWSNLLARLVVARQRRCGRGDRDAVGSVVVDDRRHPAGVGWALHPRGRTDRVARRIVRLHDLWLARRLSGVGRGESGGGSRSPPGPRRSRRSRRPG